MVSLAGTTGSSPDRCRSPITPMMRRHSIRCACSGVLTRALSAAQSTGRPSATASAARSMASSTDMSLSSASRVIRTPGDKQAPTGPRSAHQAEWLTMIFGFMYVRGSPIGSAIPACSAVIVALPSPVGDFLEHEGRALAGEDPEVVDLLLEGLPREVGAVLVRQRRGTADLLVLALDLALHPGPRVAGRGGIGRAERPC